VDEFAELSACDDHKITAFALHIYEP